LAGKEEGREIGMVSPEMAQDVILLLHVYPKNEQDNLTPEQLKQLKNIVVKEYV